MSRNIKPYLEAVQGFTETWGKTSGADARIFILDQYDRKRRSLLIRELQSAFPGVLVTVGPEAARFMRDDLDGFAGPGVYTMILNPVNILGSESGYCGIEIGISASMQIDFFRAVLPTLGRIGLLYNTGQNEDFAESADAACQDVGMQLVRLQVNNRKDIPGVIRDSWEHIEALWMIPDYMVTSESIIRYIIREAIARNVPVFGFNRFFYDNGAAVAFILDYREIGEKTASLAFERLRGNPCRYAPPVFRVWYNERILKRAGYDVPEHPAVNIEAGP